jgi:hypothetical protein
MDKAKQKKSVYNNTIVAELVLKYGFSRNYILKSIRGERASIISIKIQEEYKMLERVSNQLIKRQIGDL